MDPMKVAGVLAPIVTAIVAAVTVVAQSVVEDGLNGDTGIAAVLIGLGATATVWFWRREESRRRRELRRARRADNRNRRINAILLEHINEAGIGLPSAYLDELRAEDPVGDLDAE